MPGALSKFGRRLYTLSQLVERPRLWSLHRAGVGPESFHCFNSSWLTGAGIRTVLDIGANTGQFAQLMHAVLPEARIYSFEPLPDCFAELERRGRAFPEFRAFNVGLGSGNGELSFHRNPYADSSSFRPMADLHREQFPFTAGPETTIRVPVRTLDSMAVDLVLEDRLFVKIDVQGFEDEVIAGGRTTLARAHMVAMEISFAPLYEGAPSFDELYQTMRGMGFEFRGCLDQLVGPLNGAILQGDALFVRPG
jgi:FkbM family methyltransferase